MKEKNGKIILRIVIIILILILALLAYLYFFTLKSGGGLVSARKKEVGGMEFLFAVYGPGRGVAPRFSMPMSVATDKNNRIYVTDAGNNRVVVFDRNGSFLFQFGTKGIAKPVTGKADWEPGKFSFPYGIDVEDETGKIYVADMVNRRIQVFDSRGKFLDWFPKKPIPGFSSDIFPTDIKVQKGMVYICNPYQIVVFNTKGEPVKALGFPGESPGEFDRPNGIDVGEDGSIYVADSNNLRLQAFDSKGKLKWVIGKKPKDVTGTQHQADRAFGLPRNVDVGPDGNIYVADAFHFQIKVFSPEGKQLAGMGQLGSGEGQLYYPNGIAVTDDKIIYLVDKQANRVQALKLTKFVVEDATKSFN